ncbi:MAG: quinolinate synthase NadA [Helicobacteraceae bacterium]
MQNEIKELQKELGVTIAAHFYQKDEVFNVADITGDSLELAKRAREDPNPFLVFCGVGFMGQSVKVVAPHKRVLMPKIACCSMARMIDETAFERNVELICACGVARENILPIVYINSSAEVKALVAKMGGLVCTSSNAKKIITHALVSGKKIFFLPDRCLGQNIANALGLKSVTVRAGANLRGADVFCYDGFCSIHQLFSAADVDFYRKKYADILIAVHPECDPSVVQKADFVGSTSQIIEWVRAQDARQKIAVGTEFNLVNRLRTKNTFVLSSTKPECPTMNETTLADVLNTLRSIKDKTFSGELSLDAETAKWAKLALDRMLEIS